MNELPTIQCTKDHQSLLAAAHAAGYTNPHYRVGNMPQAQPLLWEKVVAWVQASRYSAAFPIFRRNTEEGTK